MKNILSILTIAALASACQTPAYAEDVKPDLPLPESPVPPATKPAEQMVMVSQKQLSDMATIITYVSIKYADQCQAKSTAWFCQADKILQELKAEPAPTCPAVKD